MGSVLIIVWRESLEAVLVVGILYAYLKRVGGARALRYLAAGVLGGIALSVALAYASLKIQSELQGQALAYFQAGILFVAAGLITQMVLWMDRHGRHMRRTLEQNLSHAMASGSLLGAATVAALAVAREGAEMVMFLYGLGLAHGQHVLTNLLFGSLAGLGLALLTAWAVARGIRGLNYRTFFRTTGALLLVLAAGLTVTGVNRLIQMGVLSPVIQPLWNSSWLLSDDSTAGHVVASFTGYSAHPSLSAVLAYAAYWGLVLGWRRYRARLILSGSPAASQ